MACRSGIQALRRIRLAISRVDWDLDLSVDAIAQEV
jgi:hypothetical protein